MLRAAQRHRARQITSQKSKQNMDLGCSLEYKEQEPRFGIQTGTLLDGFLLVISPFALVANLLPSSTL